MGQGASNYTLKNISITTAAGSEKYDALSLPMPQYSAQNLSFSYTPDVDLARPSMRVSAGVLIRNWAPIDFATGRNVKNIDTLRNQNDRVDGVTISDFGYGIASIGAGPLFTVGTGRFAEYDNQNNAFVNNTIEDVARAGVVLVYERNTRVESNTIRRVNNPSMSAANAVGVWASSGAAASGNRGYNTDLTINANRISDITAASGIGAGVLVENAEVVLNTPANVVQRFPAGGATNVEAWNNGIWNYAGATMSVGVGMLIDPGTRIDYTTTGNRVENNTLYNQIAGSAPEIGVYVQRSGTMVRNNIIALVSPTTAPTAIVIATTSGANVTSDYNAFWVPYGYVGAVTHLSTQGYQLPSPPTATTLNQWRMLSGQDQHSVYGNMVTEFVSTTPGAVDLHIQPNIIGSIVGNRGVAISGLTSDIDGDPRGASAVAGNYDIGFDEFTGAVRNYDLTAEDIVSPAGFKATSGQFSDAEYQMSDSAVALQATVRNLGGMPQVSRTATMSVSYRNPVGGSYTTVTSRTANTSVDVASTSTVDFGTFQPQTLRELGMSDPYYGMSPNVSPVYRVTLTLPTDDYSGNNTYVKDVRFYLQRSAREVLVSVEDMNAAGSDSVTLSNRLNSDTLLTALTNIGWGRVDGVGKEDYDLFERDKWPQQGLTLTDGNGAIWNTIMWEQGEDPEGLSPQERECAQECDGCGEPLPSYERDHRRRGCRAHSRRGTDEREWNGLRSAVRRAVPSHGVPWQHGSGGLLGSEDPRSDDHAGALRDADADGSLG